MIDINYIYPESCLILFRFVWCKIYISQKTFVGVRGGKLVCPRGIHPGGNPSFAVWVEALMLYQIPLTYFFRYDIQQYR